MGRHGAKPHTPSLGMEKCEKAALPGTHILCEHAITGKPASSAVRGAGRLHRSGIRVRKAAHTKKETDFSVSF